jgi:ferritin-like metal-binding protein YciE
MAKKIKTLNELFHETLKDIYYAENKLTKAIPKMAKATKSKELKRAFEKHAVETKGQVARLNRVFKAIGKKPQGKTCVAINGIIKEGDEVAKEFKGSPALDAGLLAAAQAVEHYEISRYGTLKAWAEELGDDESARLLDETLTEEKNTDAALSRLAESAVNQSAETA